MLHSELRIGVALSGGLCTIKSKFGPVLRVGLLRVRAKSDGAEQATDSEALKLASVSSIWMGSGSPSLASCAARPSSQSSSRASPVSVEKKSCPKVTIRPLCLAAQR
jgi:hypothetical protein